MDVDVDEAPGRPSSSTPPKPSPPPRLPPSRWDEDDEDEEEQVPPSRKGPVPKEEEEVKKGKALTEPHEHVGEKLKAKEKEKQVVEEQQRGSTDVLKAPPSVTLAPTPPAVPPVPAAPVLSGIPGGEGWEARVTPSVGPLASLAGWCPVRSDVTPAASPFAKGGWLTHRRSTVCPRDFDRCGCRCGGGGGQGAGGGGEEEGGGRGGSVGQEEGPLEQEGHQ